MRIKENSILAKIHYSLTERMSKSAIVNDYLIATITNEQGETIDCIYCTILRNAVLFVGIGIIFGFLCGRYL